MKQKTLIQSLELMSLDTPTAPVYTQLAKQIELNSEAATPHVDKEEPHTVNRSAKTL